MRKIMVLDFWKFGVYTAPRSEVLLILHSVFVADLLDLLTFCYILLT
jgi:hypothetical protein